MIDRNSKMNLPIGERPLVMGILNVTPDSFSDGGMYYNAEKASAQALLMAEQGADIIDIGGESTRPGARAIDTAEEIDRILPVLEKLKGKLTIPLSIDTRRSEVALKACRAGASIINDVSGLTYDEKLAGVAADMNSYLILMHMRGTPETMQNNTHYDNLIGEISDFLIRAAEKAKASGVAREKIIIDPGIGFGKTAEHNFSIVKHIRSLAGLGFPVLIGVSRKSFIGKTLGLDVGDRLEGSLAAAVSAVINGASIVRVHDVLPTVRALKIVDEIIEAV